MQPRHRAHLPILLAPALALALACSTAPAAPSRERDVLDAVLENVEADERGVRVAVAPQTATMSPDWFPEVGASGSGPDGALWHRLATLSSTAGRAESLALPPRAWVLSPMVATAFESHDASWRATLARVRLRLSGNHGVIALSPVAFSRDGASALVYHEYRCGSLCGRGAVSFVVRVPGGQWEVRERHLLWIR